MIAILLVLLLGVFGWFSAVRVVSFDIDFLWGFGCFWFGTLTGERYQETTSCPILQTVLSDGSLLLLSSCSRVTEFSDTLCLQCVGLRGHTKGLIQKSASWFSNQCWPMASTSPGMFPFRVWAWSVASVTDVDSMVVLMFSVSGF